LPENPQIEAASDHSLLVTFGARIDVSLHEWVRRLFLSLESAALDGVVNLHPGYASLLVDFDPLEVPFGEIENEIRRRLDDETEQTPAGSCLIEVPVCYGAQFGPDLEAVADHCGLSADQVVERHSAVEYLVYFLGFSPGFPYLGGMDPSLETPRLDSPRKSVPAGSVAIGGNQTGIYPLSSPGGWRIIGRTPLRLFEPRRQPPALMRMGDRVRFCPVTETEFAELEAKS
jgi:inhibitor of KinA